ncbi:uncharacterized protein LOC101744193 [Bombyx mori]|uniref:uncharacterized protein LOC101744193 n=1 Tax=Bombyx mori TaxID=7091 RepID=UPI002ED1B9B7
MHNMNKPFEPVFSVIQPNKPATKPKAVAMDTFPFSDKVTDENEKGNQNDTSLNLSDIPEKNKEISTENTYDTSTDSGFTTSIPDDKILNRFGLPKKILESMAG